MTDREKIIMGLEHCIADNCDLCPYDENVDCPGFDPTPKTLLADVLALLKAQEPIAPVKVNRYMETDENGNWFSPETYDCGNCGVELHGKANYCNLCGRAVKWE